MSDEVDFVDFLLLGWLRAAEPLLYRAIPEDRSRLLGEMDPTGRHWPGDKRDVDADRSHWERVFERARVDVMDREGVADVLALLFPRFDAQWSRGTRGADGTSRAGRVGHEHYFDRYFAFGVPDSDIPDSVVSRAAHDIVTGRRSSDRTLIETVWWDKQALIVAKLERFWRAGLPGSVAALEWLAGRGVSPGVGDAEREQSMGTLWLGRSLFLGLSGDAPVEAVRRMAAEDPDLMFVERMVRYAAGTDRVPVAHEASFAAARDEFARLLRQVFADQRDRNPLDYSARVWSLFWTWLAIDEAGVREWVTTHLDAGSWPLLDLLARMVNRRILGSQPTAQYVGDLELGAVWKVVDAERVWREIGPQIRDVGDRVTRDMIATNENLRTRALQALKAEGERHLEPDVF